MVHNKGLAYQNKFGARKKSETSHNVERSGVIPELFWTQDT